MPAVHPLGSRIASAACLAALLCLVPSTAQAAAPKHYANCAAMHRDYSGGIAKDGVQYNTVIAKGRTRHLALKGRVKHSTSLYRANSSLDRDKDGVLCELN